VAVALTGTSGHARIPPEGRDIRFEEVRMSVFDRVKQIIVDQLGVEPERVVLEASFREDLEADSLDLVELIMAFEEEFGGEISDEDAQAITTVQEAVTFLEKSLS